MTRAISRFDWTGRRVLVTGHTGFKGSWLSLWLTRLGAEVHGLALAPQADQRLYDALALDELLSSHIVDLRDAAAVRAVVAEVRPQIVFHLAAQSLVRRGYAEPEETFAVNAMGTIHLLEALRRVEGMEAVLVITTDKVYENLATGVPFREVDPLGAHDPYSSSKAACELVVTCWRQSYFHALGVPIATARAGNVVGGGDEAADRLLPDIHRAILSGQPLKLRYPKANRPWQHVLDPLSGYLAYAAALASKLPEVPHSLNFGPDPSDCWTVETVARRVLDRFAPGSIGIEIDGLGHAPEKDWLVLDATAARSALGWRQRLDVDRALGWVVDWWRAVDGGERPRDVTLRQLEAHRALCSGDTV